MLAVMMTRMRTTPAESMHRGQVLVLATPLRVVIEWRSMFQPDCLMHD